MSKRPFTAIHDANDVRQTADALGSYMFSDGAMRFFASRLLDTFHAITPDGSRGVIVTSERDTYSGTPRVYAVREYAILTDDAGRDRFDIDIVGERYESAYRAKSAAQAHAAAQRAALAQGDAK